MKDLKVLSVRQPWAVFLVKGLKNVENRIWRTNYRGRLLIHAPRKVDRDVNIPVARRFFPLTTSAIIGFVDLIDVCNNYDSVWADPGMYHWVVSNSVFFSDPILNVKGSLGIWTIKNDELIERVQEEISKWS